MRSKSAVLLPKLKLLSSAAFWLVQGMPVPIVIIDNYYYDQIYTFRTTLYESN